MLLHSSFHMIHDLTFVVDISSYELCSHRVYVWVGESWSLLLNKGCMNHVMLPTKAKQHFWCITPNHDTLVTLVYYNFHKLINKEALLYCHFTSVFNEQFDPILLLSEYSYLTSQLTTTNAFADNKQFTTHKWKKFRGQSKGTKKRNKCFQERILIQRGGYSILDNCETWKRRCQVRS